MKNHIVVFDIDDTLLPYGKDRLSLLHHHAINELKKENIIILATGRTLNLIPVHIIQDIQPDYYITINGHVIYDHKKEILFIQRLNTEHLLSILHECINQNFILTFKFADKHVIAHCPIEQTIPSNLNLLEEPENYLRFHESPCGAFLIENGSPITELIQKYPCFTFAKAGRNGYEIYDSTLDKSMGVQYLLNKLNMDWKQVIAFGDSENDIPLLVKANISFVMANAQAKVKQHGKQIIGACSDDGIYYALLQHNLIQEYKNTD